MGLDAPGEDSQLRREKTGKGLSFAAWEMPSAASETVAQVINMHNLRAAVQRPDLFAPDLNPKQTPDCF